MIIKEYGRLFIAVPKDWTLEDAGTFQRDFRCVLSTVDIDLTNVERLRNCIKFFTGMPLNAGQLKNFEAGQSYEAPEKKRNLNILDAEI